VTDEGRSNLSGNNGIDHYQRRDNETDDQLGVPVGCFCVPRGMRFPLLPNQQLGEAPLPKELRDS
jgi:hypothetical protein